MDKPLNIQHSEAEAIFDNYLELDEDDQALIQSTNFKYLHSEALKQLLRTDAIIKLEFVKLYTMETEPTVNIGPDSLITKENNV